MKVCQNIGQKNQQFQAYLISTIPLGTESSLKYKQHFEQIKNSVGKACLSSDLQK